VLWCCWLGDRKGIQPVKNWVVGCWCSYLSEARCRLGTQPSWCHCHSLSLPSVKSRLVLHFWYRLTRAVPDKGPLNACVCVIKNTYEVDWKLVQCWYLVALSGHSLHIKHTNTRVHTPRQHKTTCLWCPQSTQYNNTSAWFIQLQLTKS